MTLTDKMADMTNKQKREYLTLQIDKSDIIEDDVESRLKIIQDRKLLLKAERDSLP